MNARDYNNDNFEFQFKLDIDYDEWMKSKYKYQMQFRYEIASILNIRPSTITLTDYRRGSTDFKMQIAFAAAFSRWWNKTNNELHPTEVCHDFLEEMKVNNQIAVEYKGEWHNVTISKIIDSGNDGFIVFK